MGSWHCKSKWIKPLVSIHKLCWPNAKECTNVQEKCGALKAAGETSSCAEIMKGLGKAEGTRELLVLIY